MNLRSDDQDKPEFIRKVMEPMNAQRGDDLPVSAFKGAREDGTFPWVHQLMKSAVLQ
jgi:pyruvate-ferredoxin/flavodoxin oxidoreductase